MYRGARVSIITLPDSLFPPITSSNCDKDQVESVASSTFMRSHVFLKHIHQYFDPNAELESLAYVYKILSEHNQNLQQNSLRSETITRCGGVSHVKVDNLRVFDELTSVIEDILSGVAKQGLLFSNKNQMLNNVNGSVLTFILPSELTSPQNIPAAVNNSDNALAIGGYVSSSDDETIHVEKCSDDDIAEVCNDINNYNCDETPRIVINLSAFQQYKDRADSVSVLVNCTDASVTLKFLRVNDEQVELKSGYVAVFHGSVNKIQI